MMTRTFAGIGIAVIIAAAGVARVSAQDQPTGRKDCDELKMEIAAKIEANGVKMYELNIVATEEASAQEANGFKVVGSCDAGAKKIVYKRS